MADAKADLPLDRRLSLLKKSDGVTEEHVEEYKKHEVIRSALAGVKRTADIHAATRASPQKLYSAVKSKVAANVKTINKTK